MQNRLVTPGPLHDRKGHLIESGFATSLIKTYDRERIKAPGYRIKEWDYYLIGTDRYALAVTISDNGYLGLDSVSLMDFDKKTALTHTALSAFPMGKRNLPPTSMEGTSRARGKNYELNFVVGQGKRALYGHVYDYAKTGKHLLFDLELADVKQDSMVIVTPFHNKPRHFYYNQKINCLPANGSVIQGEETLAFAPATAFGVLDWGRGVWPYTDTWYWGSASGIVDRKAFGFNIGHGFGDTSRASENMVFYGGTAHKLGQVDFKEPRSGGKADYLAPWQVSDTQGRLKLTFEPLLDRAANINALVLASDQHQVFGRFHGTAVLDDGRMLNIRNLTGFLEKVANRR